MFLYSFIYDVMRTERSSASYINRYFQLMYNITALFNSGWVVSTDGGAYTTPSWYGELRKQLKNCSERNNLLANMCYIAHSGFLGYTNYRQRFVIYGIKDINIVPFISEKIYEYGKQFSEASLKDDVYERGTSTDYAGEVEKMVSSCVYRNMSIGELDTCDDATSTPYMDAVHKLLGVYENMDDLEKTVCSFFHSADPLYFWISMTCVLSQKYNIETESAVQLFFTVTTFIKEVYRFNASFREKYGETVRPYHWIRSRLCDTEITSWTPYGTMTIKGSKWLPYQNISQSVAHYPCVGTLWGVVSVVAVQLLTAWFGNQGELYDGFKVVSLPSGYFFSKTLDSQVKRFLCGEFVVQRGGSVIEPARIPANVTVLRYPFLSDLLNDILVSGIYGGINTCVHSENSRKIGETTYRLIRDNFVKTFTGFPNL